MAKRRVFYSFNYKEDNWRVSQIKNMGLVEGNEPVSANDWEEIKNDGKEAIEKWIDDNLRNRSCTIVLVGEKTAGRPWINYEIKKSWEDGKGVVGIHIHNLKDSNEEQSNKGDNPFDNFRIDDNKLSSIVECHNPPHLDSKDVYSYIKDNLENWIEEAIKIRGDHPI